MRAERKTRNGREPAWEEAAGRTRDEARRPHAQEHTLGRGLVAVFHSEPEAERAASAVAAALPNAQVSVGDDEARIASLRGEMAEEGAMSTAGPSVGLWTKEMTAGAFWGTAMWTIGGAALALPFAFIPFADMSIVARLLIVGIVGAVAGATFGFVAGGAAGAKGPAEPMAAEVGVSLFVGVPEGEDSDRATEMLSAANPIRIDEFHDRRPDGTVDGDGRA